MVHDDKAPMARPLYVDFERCVASSPRVVYAPNDQGTVLEFSAPSWELCSGGRIEFENLDAVRVCRGEYSPFDCADDVGAPYPWIWTIEHSPWLIERHAYESQHYRDCYEWGGDVDEMLRDFRHYLFCFHDEFVEAIAAGIWVVRVGERRSDAPADTAHPFLPLPESSRVESWEIEGVVCEIRQSPLSREQLAENARLCSQPLIDFIVLEPDGAESHWTRRVRLRSRVGRLISQLVRDWGAIEGEYDGVATLATVRPEIEAWLREIAELRRTSTQRDGE